MTEKPFTHIAVGVFALMSILHVLRLILGWEVSIASVVIPMWVSVAGCIIAAILAVLVWREGRT